MTKRRTRTKAKAQPKQTLSPAIIGGVVIIAILIVIGLILLGNQSSNANATVEISQFPAKGAADAPVTIIEYSDYG